MNKIISGEEARQGRKGTRVLLILIISLILVGIVWIGTEYYGESIEPGPEESIPSQPAD